MEEGVYVMFTNERRHVSDISYHEDEVKLAKKMIDTLRTTMEFLYYLMEHRSQTTLTMILISTKILRLEPMLQKWKRDTDILFEIDKLNNVYVLICQSTDHKGAQEFGDILLGNIHLNGGEETYCVASELISTKNTIQEVIFKTVEKYIIIKHEEKSKKVFFTDLAKMKKSSAQTDLNDEHIIYHTEKTS